MVALTQKNFSAHYAWFPRGRSHMAGNFGEHQIWRNGSQVVLGKIKFDDLNPYWHAYP